MPTKIDDKTFEDFGFREVVGHRNPSTPEITQRTVTIPGTAGVWSFGHQIGTRTFEIPLKHLYNDMYKRQRFLNKLVAFLFDDYGNPREFKLIFEYEPDKYYKVQVKGQLNPDRLIHSNSFILMLIANDPNKFLLSPMDKIVWGSNVPFHSDILFGTGSNEFDIKKPQTISFLNQGSLVQKLNFKISGSGIGVTLSNGRETCSFNTFSNSTIIVSGDRYLVNINGVDNLVFLKGAFLSLLKGENKLRINGSFLNFKITINNNFEYL